MWLLRVTPAWALALTDWLSVGGRQGIGWYDAENIRSSSLSSELEVAVHTRAGAPLRHRVALGYEKHRMESMDVQRADGNGAKRFYVGGVGDSALRAGYAGELSREALVLGYEAQARYVSLYGAHQRQLRLASRLSYALAKGHTPFVEGVLYVVHRDREQAGHTLLRTSAHGQVVAGYDYMMPSGVGLTLRGRLLTSFMSGEAAYFELREESLRQRYGEALVGVVVVWR